MTLITLLLILLVIQAAVIQLTIWQMADKKQNEDVKLQREQGRKRWT